MTAPKASIIISNYNYQNYIIETIQSVLDQTYTNIEIIIVDDGSTDNSVAIINEQFKELIQAKKISLIVKENGGQLSAFNTAIPHLSGKYTFFLDADDLYKTNYIEKTIDVFEEKKDIDFIYSRLSYFTKNPNNIIKTISPFNKNLEIGYTYYSSILSDEILGIATSGISMRTSLAKTILPMYELESYWKICADVCLKLASSIAGANKYYSYDNDVLYRVHSNNNFTNNEQISKRTILKEQISTNMLKGYLLNKFSVNIPNTFNQRYLKRIYSEYTLRGDISKNVKKNYMEIINNSKSKLVIKYKYLYKIAKQKPCCKNRK